MRKITVVIIVVSVFFVSCKMFTTPILSGRDLGESLSNSSTDAIIDLLNSGQAISSEDAKGIANALAGKDAEELNSLSAEDKAAIVNVTVSGIMPSPDELLDVAGDMSEDELADSVTGLLGSIDADVDTGAIDSLFNNDEAVKELLEEDPNAVLYGTLALAMSISANTGVLENNDSLDTLFDSTISELENAYSADGSITPEEQAAVLPTLAAALNTDPETVESLLNVTVIMFEMGKEDESSLGFLSDFMGL